MAKDVVTFLSWAAEPEHDERKKYGIKAVIIFSTLFAISLYVKRFKWGAIKNRKISMDFPQSLTEKTINTQSLQFITLPPIKFIKVFTYFRVDESGGLKMLLNTTSNRTVNRKCYRAELKLTAMISISNQRVLSESTAMFALAILRSNS